MDNLGKEDSEVGLTFLEQFIWLVWRASWENKSRWWEGYLEMIVDEQGGFSSAGGAGSPYLERG